jgi:hypothetical protein
MPWGVAAAVVVGAISASEQSKSASEAAGVQERSAAAAVSEQRRQFDVSQAQAEPFRQAGLSALEQQQALLGLSGVGAQQAALEQFQESPGQAFLRERGEQALLRSSAAIGGLGGGQVRSALQQQGIGFAQQDLQNQLGRLGGIAGQGQAITSNVAQLGAGTASNIGNLLQAGGQAQASGILGAQQARSQFAGQIGSGLVGGTMGAQTEGVGFSQGAAAGLSRF